MSGRILRTWPKDEKYEVIGNALDGRTIGMVCRFTSGGKVMFSLNMSQRVSARNVVRATMPQMY